MSRSGILQAGNSPAPPAARKATKQQKIHRYFAASGGKPSGSGAEPDASAVPASGSAGGADGGAVAAPVPAASAAGARAGGGPSSSGSALVCVGGAGGKGSAGGSAPGLVASRGGGRKARRCQDCGASLESRSFVNRRCAIARCFSCWEKRRLIDADAAAKRNARCSAGKAGTGLRGVAKLDDSAPEEKMCLRCDAVKELKSFLKGSLECQWCSSCREDVRQMANRHRERHLALRNAGKVKICAPIKRCECCAHIMNRDVTLTTPMRSLVITRSSSRAVPR